MQFTIDQILLMQDTIMAVRLRHMGMDSIWDRLTPDRSIAIYSSAHNGTISLEGSNGLMVTCHVPYAVNN